MTSIAEVRTRATRRSNRRLGVLIVLALVALTTGCGAGNPSSEIKDVTEYVALGDSYTAVAGTGPFTDKLCLRSNADYPALLAAKLGIKFFKDTACAGAMSSNLTASQVPQSGSGTNPPQLEAVTKGAKLITLGIGLNDYGLSYYLLYACLPVSGRTPQVCKDYLKQPSSLIDGAIKKMGALVKGNLRDIRHAAPNARIVLVGYPRLLADDANCNAQVPLPTKALDRIRKALLDVNDTLRSVAAQAGVDFIDMYAPSQGHDVCSADPWVNGKANISGKALAFHPYDAYHVAVADKIAALLQKK